MVGMLKKIAFSICLSNVAPSTIYCMDFVINDPKIMFYSSVCSYLENDAASELNRLAIQLSKLGIDIMDFSMNTLGDTPPHYAVRNQKAKCFRVLLTLDSVKNALDKKNNNTETFFDLVAQSNNQEIRYLCFNNNALKHRYIEAKVRNLAITDLPAK